YFDDDGKSYIIYNSDPPDRKPLYSGHRSIKIVQYDIPNRKVIGEEKMLVNGGVDITQNPVWVEAPHIYKINGWYYLMCAEGGTGYNHSEVIFRSKHVDGPYTPGPVNPILTQRDLDTSRKYPVTTAGHADLVETPDGKWYAVFLGCRPYEGDYYNTGRETFLTPVEWKNEWPLINPGFKEIQYQYPVPFASTKKVNNAFSGNYTFKDDFKGSMLNERFMLLRNPEAGLYKQNNGFLELPLKQTTAAESGNPAFIGFRQAHLKGDATTSVLFNATKENEKAGLMIFQSEHAFYFLCKSVREGKPVVELYKAATKKDKQPSLLASADLKSNKSLQLKIEANGGVYNFYYAEIKDKWTLLKDNVDGKFLSTKAAGGFVGSLYALYATSNGTVTTNKALYDWFEYKGDDDVYKHLK
ncbi:MAG: family 43 glycosylhydrolase, partial [Ferruginibacter sp.]